ncbi:MAG: CGNR zinc finger domain-containing protein [Gemmatimonadales bacterium]
MASKRGAGTIPLIGGHVALDFANTAGWHASEERSEWLTDYGEVLAWARHAARLPPRVAAALKREVEHHAARGRTALGRVVACRETIYRIFTALAHEARPEGADLRALHVLRVRAIAAAEPTWSATDGAGLGWGDPGKDLLYPIYPVVVAAATLLEQGELGRLRQCGNHPCGWLFFDASRNGTRRWCTSAECGNATRVRRFRARAGGRRAKK